MIYDRVERRGFYRGLGGGVVRALGLLASGEAARLPLGRRELGDGGAVILSRYVPGGADEEPFETHRRFLDLHAVLEGEELLGYAPAPDLSPVRPYEEDDDCALHRGPGVWLSLRPGWFALLGPDDAHQPGVLSPRAGGEVLKAVFKIPLV